MSILHIKSFVKELMCGYISKIFIFCRRYKYTYSTKKILSRQNGNTSSTTSHFTIFMYPHTPNSVKKEQRTRSNYRYNFYCKWDVKVTDGSPSLLWINLFVGNTENTIKRYVIYEPEVKMFFMLTLLGVNQIRNCWCNVCSSNIATFRVSSRYCNGKWLNVCQIGLDRYWSLNTY